ncbi:MAG TPA: class I tRNA ligase family protein, partial [Terriglobales bacterium]|nr:class I tRNA ligase family protein [Terriglobales bacterium]
RQRVWGVPITVFFCEACGKMLESKEVNAAVVELFRREGSDSWYRRPPEEILPAGTKCTCGNGEFRKENDIIDVWFESGSSQAAVLGHEPGLPWPADLYLEGADQFRGWFQSSLLCAIGSRNQAPYRMAVTPGWTLDPQGRAMSKSLGNVVDPVDISNRFGAEIVRLWVASVDFREDMRVSEELLVAVTEVYRKLRNTFRYILGNLYDFKPAEHAVNFADMQPLDQDMLLRMRDFTGQLVDWYNGFEFHRIYHALNEFCAVDLSNVYFDVLKDRLYTAAPNSRARRSAQTAVWRIGEALVRLAAPIMTFTAEEVWSYLAKLSARPESVHLAYFPQAADITGEPAEFVEPKGLRSDFDALLAVRAEVLKALEVARKEKLIGSGLEAVVTIHAPENTFKLLERYQSGLRFLFIVSAVQVKRAGEGNGAAPLRVEVSKAPGQKCARCWNYSTEVGKSERYPTVCERCLATLEEMEQGQGVPA